MSNYYNSETLLEQQDEIEKLKAERDALAAQVEAFKKIREDWKGLAINDAKTLIAFIEAADKAPQQHLAEIRAEAGRAGFVEGVRQEMLDKFGLFYLETQDRANQYAEQIRKGEVK